MPIPKLNKENQISITYKSNLRDDPYEILLSKEHSSVIVDAVKYIESASKIPNEHLILHINFDTEIPSGEDLGYIEIQIDKKKREQFSFNAKNLTLNCLKTVYGVDSYPQKEVKYAIYAGNIEPHSLAMKIDDWKHLIDNYPINNRHRAFDSLEF